MKNPSSPPSQTEPSTSPGWVYCAFTGLCLGPASYEQAKRYVAYAPSPMPWNYAGMPTKVVIRKGPRQNEIIVRA